MRTLRALLSGVALLAGAAKFARSVHPREAQAPPACAPDATTRTSTTSCVAGGYAARPGPAWSSPIRVP